MKRFRFIADFTANADSIETLLSDLSGHIKTMARHAGNGRDDDDVCSLFTVEEVTVDEAAEAKARAIADADGSIFRDGTVDLRHDHITADHGPIELTLDPDSAAGRAHAEQKLVLESERSEMKRRRANEGRSDAEIMAEHSAKEQAGLNG